MYKSLYFRIKYMNLYFRIKNKIILMNQKSFAVISKLLHRYINLLS